LVELDRVALEVRLVADPGRLAVDRHAPFADQLLRLAPRGDASPRQDLLQPLLAHRQTLAAGRERDSPRALTAPPRSLRPPQSPPRPPPPGRLPAAPNRPRAGRGRSPSPPRPLRHPPGPPSLPAPRARRAPPLRAGSALPRRPPRPRADRRLRPPGRSPGD